MGEKIVLFIGWMSLLPMKQSASVLLPLWHLNERVGVACYSLKKNREDTIAFYELYTNDERHLANFRLVITKERIFTDSCILGGFVSPFEENPEKDLPVFPEEPSEKEIYQIKEARMLIKKAEEQFGWCEDFADDESTISFSESTGLISKKRKTTIKGKIKRFWKRLF